jgi:hypothetical protein
MCLSDLTIPVQLCIRRFAIKITLGMKISKVQRQMIKRDGTHLPSPVLTYDQLHVVFFRYSSFHNADIAILMDIGTAQKIIDL